MLLASGLGFFTLATLGPPFNAPGAQAVMVFMGLFCLSGIPVLLDPRRFKWISRLLTGTVFLLCLAYFVSEWLWHPAQAVIRQPGRPASPLKATRALIVIGLPCLWWTLLGRFSWKKPEPEESQSSSRS